MSRLLFQRHHPEPLVAGQRLWEALVVDVPLLVGLEDHLQVALAVEDHLQVALGVEDHQ